MSRGAVRGAAGTFPNFAGISPAYGNAGEYWSYPIIRGTAAMVDGTVYAYPCYVPAQMGVDRIGAVVTGASTGTIALGIYNDDGTGDPGTLLVDAGTINGASATAQELTIAVTLLGGRVYWLAAMADGGTPTVRNLLGSNYSGTGRATSLAAATGTSGFPGRIQQSVVGAALPNPMVPDLTNLAFAVAIRFA